MFQRTTAINKILKLQKRIRVVQGGTSAGKTFGILPVLIDRACKTPGLEISVVSESVPHLRRGALKDFLKIMKETNRYIEFNYNKTLLKYTFTNGSYIEFFSVEQEASVRGQRRNILYINECNNISFELYHQLAIRTSHEIYLDYNPSGEFWVQTEIEKDINYEKIILTYKDNEALPDSIRQEIEKAQHKAKESKYWENWWRVYGLGLMGTLEGVIFGEFKHCTAFPFPTPDNPSNQCKWIVYGMDFGFTNDPTTLIRIGLKDGEIYLEQLLYRTGMTNNDIHLFLKEQNIGRSEIVADSAEPKSIEELNRLGWNVIKCIKGNDSVRQGIDLLRRYKTNITSNSIELIKEWREGYRWKHDRATNKYLQEPVDANNHCIDAARYGLVYKLTAATGGKINLPGRIIR